MFRNDHLHEEGDIPLVAVKQEFITVKEEYDEINVDPNLDNSKDEDDPLEINEKEREIFLHEEKLAKEEPEVVSMNRGGPGLLYQGHAYTKFYIYKRKLVIRWWCKRYPKCRGTVDTNLKCKVAKIREGHDHPPNYIATEAAKVKYNLIGSHICNFFREDGTFMIPYKENAKKKLKDRNPFGIHNTLHCWQRPVQSQTTKKQTSKSREG